MKEITCGIDFGTSNSSIAIAKENEVKLVAVEGNHQTIPSAIFYPAIGEKSIGRAAIKDFLSRREGRFMRSLKRVLGTSVMKQGTLINGKVLTFDRIIATYVEQLKNAAQHHVQQDIESVVMGRPVHFVDHNPSADAQAENELLRIAKSVGFKEVVFQYEPIAAAFAHEQHVVGEELALVVDMGGGTSDFTVIRLSEKSRVKIDRKDDILGNTGVRIGGNDFDKALSLAAVMPSFGYKSTFGDKRLEVPLKYYFDLSEWSKVNLLYVPKVLSQLTQYLHQSHDKKSLARMVEVVEDEMGHVVLTETEKLKIGLTQSSISTAHFDLKEKFTLEAHRDVFDKSIAIDLQKVMSAVHACLQQADVGVQNISLVILTGGSTEVPLVQETFRALFPTATFSFENKLSSVGLGLGYDSMRRFL
jgi:hypothetical chaperone protein